MINIITEEMKNERKKWLKRIEKSKQETIKRDHEYYERVLSNIIKENEFDIRRAYVYCKNDITIKTRSKELLNRCDRLDFNTVQLWTYKAQDAFNEILKGSGMKITNIRYEYNPPYELEYLTLVSERDEIAKNIFKHGYVYIDLLFKDEEGNNE